MSHTHGEIIRKIFFFKDKDKSFLWKVLPMLKRLKVPCDDIVYNQRENAKEIYFILKGRVKMWYDLAPSNNMKPVYFGFQHYVEGSHFGDADLISGIHDSTAIPTEEAHLFVLSQINIKKLIERWPKQMKSFKILANKRKISHIDNIIKSLQKDKEAYEHLEKVERLKVAEPNSPCQFIVKLIIERLENKTNMSDFEAELMRLIRTTPTALPLNPSQPTIIADLMRYENMTVSISQNNAIY